MTLAQAIQQRITSHNWHVTTVAFFSLLGASVLWTVLYALSVGLALGFLTILYGQEVIAGNVLQTIPHWLNIAAGGLAVALFCWAAMDEHLLRYRPPPERAIIGWHVLGDFLLLAPRLTFAVMHHLSAFVMLRAGDAAVAAQVLEHVHAVHKCPRSSLAFVTGNADCVARILRALSLIGWMATVRISDDWALVIPSEVEPYIRQLLGHEEP